MFERFLKYSAKSMAIVDFGQAGNYMFHDRHISYHALGSKFLQDPDIRRTAGEANFGLHN